MKEFQISVKETYELVVPEKANSYNEAVEKVRQKYRNSEIILDSSSFKDVEFSSPEGIWLQ